MPSWPTLGQLHLYLYPTVFGPEYVQFVFVQTVTTYGKEGLIFTTKCRGLEHADLCIGGLSSLYCQLHNKQEWEVVIKFFFFGATAPQWARAPSCTRFLDHTQRRTTVGRTPLDE